MPHLPFEQARAEARFEPDLLRHDPGAPLRLNPAYNSGDNLHPNDAGYEAMANAINLTLLTPN